MGHRALPDKHEYTCIPILHIKHPCTLAYRRQQSKMSLLHFCNFSGETNLYISHLRVANHLLKHSQSASEFDNKSYLITNSMFMQCTDLLYEFSAQFRLLYQISVLQFLHFVHQIKFLQLVFFHGGPPGGTS